MQRIYLDFNAGTPVDPRLSKILINELNNEVGNPSSSHYFGRQARQKLDQSRENIAHFFSVKTNEIIFTSGGTEGASLLIRGLMLTKPNGHIISTAVEHAATYHTLLDLQKQKNPVTFLPVGARGAVQPEEVEKAITPQTRLITLMAVNNETGVMTDIEAIATIAHAHRIPFIVDAVAWLGKEKVSLYPGISALFFSGHKIHAPKGIGFCICRSTLKLCPLFLGGEQEYNRRAGTENLPGIIALSEAIKLLKNEDEMIAHMRSMRDLLEKELLSRLPNVTVNGSGPRICNTSNLAFQGCDGEALLIELDLEGIAVSHGSACASGALEPSRVLLKMGISLSQARSSLRFSVGRTTTEDEIYRVVNSLTRIVKRNFHK